MHIGWDLDDITTNLTEELLRIYNRRYRTNISLEEVNDWGFFSEEVHEEIKQAGYRNLKLIAPAKEVLKQLKKRGDTISIITYRSPEYEKETGEWLEENIPGLYEGVYLAGGSKLEVCGRIGVQILVDDSKRQVREVSGELGIHTILLRTWMNRDVESSELIHVAGNLSDVLDWIEKLRFRIDR